MELTKEKKELFETMPVRQAVQKMTVPTVASSLVMMIYGLADTYFVGLLNDPVQTAGVTLASTILLSFNALNNLFGMGGASLFSRLLGVGDFEGARKVGAFCIYWAAICGAVYSAVIALFKLPILNMLGADDVTRGVTGNYLFWVATCGALPAILNVVLANIVRAEGSALNASSGTMSGCILNMVLDPLFILPRFLGMGAAGAGLATFISNSAATLYFFAYIAAKKGKTFVSLHPSDFKGSGKYAKKVLSVGLPSALQNLFNVACHFVLNNFAAVYGASAVAAIGIASKITMVPMYVCMGLTNGIAPLISYNYSSGNARRLKDCFEFTIKLAVGISLAMTLICFLFPAQLMSVFNRNPEIIELGTLNTRILSLYVPFFAVDMGAVSLYVSCGMGRKSLVCAVIRKIILEIPLLFVFRYFLGYTGLACAQPAAEVIMTAVALINVRAIYKELGLRQ